MTVVLWTNIAYAGQKHNPFTNKPDYCSSIKEGDGSPNLTACQTIEFPNGSLSSTGAVSFGSAGGGSTSPGGSNTQVQYNDSSAFGGDSGLTFNETTDLLSGVAANFSSTVTGTVALDTPNLENAAGTTVLVRDHLTSQGNLTSVNLSASNTVTGTFAVDTRSLYNSNAAHINLQDGLWVRGINSAGGTITGTLITLEGTGTLQGLDSIDTTTRTTLESNLNISGPDISGTLSSATVANDSHDHTSATLSSVDVSSDTNLAGTALQITLTDDTLSLPDSLSLAGKSAFVVPTSSAPSGTTPGLVAMDSNAWAASRGALQVYDGTANTYVVAALTSDTPSDGQFPRWNTGGTITWESPSGAGDVVGPSSATDNALVRFDSTTGKLVQNSSTTLDDSGNMVVAGTLTVGGSGASMAFEGGATDPTLAYDPPASTGIFYLSDDLKVTGTITSTSTVTGTLALDTPNLANSSSANGGNVIVSDSINSYNTVTGTIVDAPVFQNSLNSGGATTGTLIRDIGLFVESTDMRSSLMRVPVVSNGGDRTFGSSFRQYQNLRVGSGSDADTGLAGDLTNDVTVEADGLVLVDNLDVPFLAESVNVTCAMDAAGINGIESSDSRVVNTWYEVYVIARESGTKACLLNRVSTPIGTMPGGYLYRQLVSYARNEATNVLDFRQANDWQYVLNVDSTIISSSTSMAGTRTAFSTGAYCPPSTRMVAMSCDIEDTDSDNAAKFGITGTTDPVINDCQIQSVTGGTSQGFLYHEVNPNQTLDIWVSDTTNDTLTVLVTGCRLNL